MSGSASSRLPVRNPVARPVSLHSPSEHQRNNPVYLSPHSHRRPRRPRSSPLAGPSLSSDQLGSDNKNGEGNPKPRYRPNRISSTPDLVVPIHSLYDSDTASISSSSPPSIISNGTSVAFPHPPVFKSSGPPSSGGGDKVEDAEDGGIFRSLAKRLSIASISSFTTNERSGDDQNTNKRHSSFMSHSTSTTSLASTSSSRTAWTDGTGQTAPPIPTIPQWALKAMREEAVIANRKSRFGHREGKRGDLTTSPSSLHFPSQPTRSSDQLRPSASGDSKGNWMFDANPTPRFSRLGLGGNGVVMPVSRKDLVKARSAGSIRVARSMTTISQSAGARRDGGVPNKAEPGPEVDSSNDRNAANTRANLKGEEGPRKRASLPVPPKSKIPRIGAPSSAQSENVLPRPHSITSSCPTSTSDTNSYCVSSTSNGSALRIKRASLTPPSSIIFPDSTKIARLRRGSTPTSIDDNQPPSPSLKDISAEFGRKVGDAKSQDTQKARTRRKSIKQIVMRITAAPMSIGEKLRVTTIHDPPSKPEMDLPPETPTRLDPPPSTRFGRFASSSVPCLPSTKQVSELDCSPGEARGNKRFKGFRKKWKAIFGDRKKSS